LFFLLHPRPRQRSALRLFSYSADPPPATSVWLIFLHACWISSDRVRFREHGSSLECPSRARICVLRFSSPAETARPVKFQLCIFVSCVDQAPVFGLWFRSPQACALGSLCFCLARIFSAGYKDFIFSACGARLVPDLVLSPPIFVLWIRLFAAIGFDLLWFECELLQG
jgi:hypothetical protein